MVNWCWNGVEGRKKNDLSMSWIAGALSGPAICKNPLNFVKEHLRIQILNYRYDFLRKKTWNFSSMSEVMSCLCCKHNIKICIVNNLKVQQWQKINFIQEKEILLRVNLNTVSTVSKVHRYERLPYPGEVWVELLLHAKVVKFKFFS